MLRWGLGDAQVSLVLAMYLFQNVAEPSGLPSLWTIAVWATTALAIWRACWWILGDTLRRAHIPMCPKCFSTSIRRSHRRGWENLVPFLRFYRCRDCQERFLRGGRPPFASCQKCGSFQLQAGSLNRVAKGFSIIVGRLLRWHTYRCPQCRYHFLDPRPLRRQRESREKESTTEPSPG